MPAGKAQPQQNFEVSARLGCGEGFGLGKRKSGGKCGYLLASPLAAAAGFHCLPALAAAWENGSRSRRNLLRAGRTQVTAPSSPGPTRGAAPTPRFGGSERCEDKKHSSGLCRRWERGDRGVPGSGGFYERSLACSERTGPGSCLGAGQHLGDCRVSGRREIPQVCNGHCAFQAGAATCGKAWRWGSGCCL